MVRDRILNKMDLTADRLVVPESRIETPSSFHGGTHHVVMGVVHKPKAVCGFIKGLFLPLPVRDMLCQYSGSAL